MKIIISIIQIDICTYIPKRPCLGHYNAQSRLPYHGSVIKVLFVCSRLIKA